MRSLNFIARALLCAGTTTLGSLPIALVGDMTDVQMGSSISVAAGMMSGCSLVLAVESVLAASCLAMVVGVILGGLLIHTIQWIFAERTDLIFGELKGSSATGALIIFLSMYATGALIIFLSMMLHSLGEGLSIGVSALQAEDDEHRLNSVVLLSLAVHNIPEGMAICMAYRSKGMSIKRAAWYAFLSNLPQPLSAVASFSCMKHLSPSTCSVPIGLGMASGAMCYVVFKELAPEALEKVSRKRVAPLMLVSGLVVLVFDAYHHLGSHDGSTEIMPSTGIPRGQDL
eukprot:CAMPEP_0180671520 /NCGR_PEP_ID=MMETSP1037_2-20121125/64623_1 /TAXON_ID=632150 /ORGANISM="Azadinium spinosum, Strain 3D9" /LENGTH=285 /DNA_ID=CAMNT_0022700563 /DNA_START=47 /DNA_END=905 /DNA_ORIENTATION=-